MVVVTASPPVRRGVWVARVMLAQMQRIIDRLVQALALTPEIEKNGDFVLLAV